MDAQEDLDVSGNSAAFGLWCRASDSHGYTNSTSEARPQPSRPGREINEWEKDGDGSQGLQGSTSAASAIGSARLESQLRPPKRTCLYEFANVRFGDTRGG